MWEARNQLNKDGLETLIDINSTSNGAFFNSKHFELLDSTVSKEVWSE